MLRKMLKKRSEASKRNENILSFRLDSNLVLYFIQGTLFAWCLNRINCNLNFNQKKIYIFRVFKKEEYDEEEERRKINLSIYRYKCIKRKSK